jgi:hypothetical protein
VTFLLYSSFQPESGEQFVQIALKLSNIVSSGTITSPTGNSIWLKKFLSHDLDMLEDENNHSEHIKHSSQIKIKNEKIPNAEWSHHH